MVVESVELVASNVLEFSSTGCARRGRVHGGRVVQRSNALSGEARNMFVTG
jgi:hypothetical protein